MRVLKAILLVPALLLLVVGLAAAKGKPGPGARLDPHFGKQGSFVISTPIPPEGEGRIPPTHLAVGKNGESFVQQGELLVAFGANGRPDDGFGQYGRVSIAPGVGKVTEVSDVAVDSKGRVLVAGTLEPVPGLKEKVLSGTAEEFWGPQHVVEAFAIRYLQNGHPDPTFGNGGVAITSFGLPTPTGWDERPATYERPLVRAATITVDGADRPVIAGRFVEQIRTCFYKATVDRAFTGRLTASGTLDTSFGEAGHSLLASERLLAFAGGPEGQWAALSNPETCEHGGELTAQLSVLTEAGAPSPSVDPNRPGLLAGGELTGGALAVDQKGRFLYAEGAESEPPKERIIRLLADGDLDPSFGRGGGADLSRLPVSGPIRAIAVDSKGRIVVGLGYGGLEVARLSEAGKIEAGFGQKGILRMRLGIKAPLQALAIDSKGRIVAAGSVQGGGLKTGQGIAIARYLPGK